MTSQHAPPRLRFVCGRCASSKVAHRILSLTTEYMELVKQFPAPMISVKGVSGPPSAVLSTLGCLAADRVVSSRCLGSQQVAAEFRSSNEQEALPHCGSFFVFRSPHRCFLVLFGGCPECRGQRYPQEFPAGCLVEGDVSFESPELPPRLVCLFAACVESLRREPQEGTRHLALLALLWHDPAT